MSENDKTESLRSLLINIEYQNAWEELLQTYLSNPCNLTNPDLIDYFQSIRYYTLNDHLADNPAYTHKLLKALYYLADISEILARDISLNNDAKSQISKNLFLCIESLNSL